MEDIRKSSQDQAYYNVLFIARRLISVCVLVFLSEYQILQIVLLLTMSLMQAGFLLAVKPFAKP